MRLPTVRRSHVSLLGTSLLASLSGLSISSTSRIDGNNKTHRNPALVSLDISRYSVSNPSRTLTLHVTVPYVAGYNPKKCPLYVSPSITLQLLNTLQ